MMNKSGKTRFKLSPENFISWESDCSTLRIDKNNYQQYESKIKETINVFNDEIVWDDMYDYNEGIKRLLDDEYVLFLLLKNSVLCGYFWVKKYRDGIKILNVFMRNKNIKKRWSGKEFLSKIIKQYYPKTYIYVEIDDWNSKSIRLFKNLGFYE